MAWSSRSPNGRAWFELSQVVQAAMRQEKAAPTMAGVRGSAGSWLPVRVRAWSRDGALHGYSVAYAVAAGIFVAGAFITGVLYRSGIPEEIRSGQMPVPV